MKIWTYRFAFRLGNDDFLVEAPVGLKTIETRLSRGGLRLARDFTNVLQPGGTRNHQLRCTLDDGRQLEVEAGYLNWWRMGIAVRIDGALVHESSPGSTIRFPGIAGRDPEAFARQQAQFEAQQAEQSAAFARNKYSIFVDLAIGALFFVLVKLTDDLPLSAVATAGAGLAVVVAQRFVKVDLIGGLALFGIVMLLVSAGFSWFFDDDWAVKMKSTILGLMVATVTLADAIFRQGRYFGARLMRYMMQPMDPQRLAGGLGVLGLVMAGVNWVFAEFTSQDTWLYYTSFGDFLLSVVLMLGVMRYARSDPAD